MFVNVWKHTEPSGSESSLADVHGLFASAESHYLNAAHKMEDLYVCVTDLNVFLHMKMSSVVDHACVASPGLSCCFVKRPQAFLHHLVPRAQTDPPVGNLLEGKRLKVQQTHMKTIKQESVSVRSHPMRNVADACCGFRSHCCVA